MHPYIAHYLRLTDRCLLLQTYETVVDGGCEQEHEFEIVRCTGHQHIGSRCITLYNADNGDRICQSCPVYGTEPGAVLPSCFTTVCARCGVGKECTPYWALVQPHLHGCVLSILPACAWGIPHRQCSVKEFNHQAAKMAQLSCTNIILCRTAGLNLFCFAAGKAGNEKGYVVKMTDDVLSPPYKIAPGTKVRLESAYDGTQRRTGVMGLVNAWVTGLSTPCYREFGYYHYHHFHRHHDHSHAATLGSW